MSEICEQLKATEAAFQAARAAAGNIATEESQAMLGDDENWLRWSRRKKLAGIEVARLEGEIAKIKQKSMQAQF